MAHKIWSVFLSSTYKDLIDHRKAVSLILRQNDFQVREMETSPARGKEPQAACLDDVAEADFFVGIYARRYGFVPSGSTTSITELELLEAQALDKPIFCFLMDEAFDWPAASREEGEGARNLEELRKRIQEQEFHTLDSSLFFTTPDNLAAQVLSALTKERNRELEAPPVSKEREDLLRLLKKVELLWVKRVLDPAVPKGWRLRIEREERPKAVGRFVPEEWLPETAGLPREPVYDFLLRQDRKLLLLGEPGSGKTIAIIELARALARRVSRDPDAPVPVVFNLASWGEDDRELTVWMAREMHKRYEAREDQAKEWIVGHLYGPHNQILPLLDGLDEVAWDARKGCVEAINAHLEERGLEGPGMVVACHLQAYQELLPTHILHLDTAVALRPLTPAQVDQHLDTAGQTFSGLRTALAGDAGLRELASTPLMVFLLKKTFKGLAPEDLPPGLTAVQTAPLWKAFVKRMLEPHKYVPWRVSDLPPPKNRFSPEKTRRSLAWLAQEMLRQHDPAQLQIEHLQPAWLPGNGKLFGSPPHAVYSLLHHIAGGVLLTLPPALWMGRADFAAAGLLAGLLVGLLEIPRLLREAPRAGGARAILRRAFLRTLCLGGLTTLLLVLLVSPWVQLTGGSRSDGLRSAVLVGLLAGAVFGTRGAVRSGKRDIRVAEKLIWRGWSRRGALFGAGSALLASLAFWGLYLASGSRTGFGPEFWIPFSAIVTLLGAALFGAFGGLGREIIPKTSGPNQGTKRALRNAGFVALLTAFFTISGLELALAALHLAQAVFEGEPLSLARNVGNALALLKTGAALGFWAGLGYSGLDFVQHYALRLVLWIWGLVPLRLVSFLDHAVKRGLLRGHGNYQFIHPLLRGWFAESYGSEQDRTD